MVCHDPFYLCVFKSHFLFILIFSCFVYLIICQFCLSLQITNSVSLYMSVFLFSMYFSSDNCYFYPFAYAVLCFFPLIPFLWSVMELFTWIFLPFKIWSSVAINLPLITDFAAYCKFWFVVLLFLFVSRCFLIFLLTSFLIYWLFKSWLFNFYIFVNFSIFLLSDFKFPSIVIWKYTWYDSIFSYL